PLFMRVTLDYLCERGNVSRAAHGWRLLILVNRLAPETPPTLARAIEIRIEGMTDEQRRVLVVASVAGEHFDPITLASVAEMDEESFEAICESLTPSIIRRGELLILPSNQLVRTYTFTHALYRRALYDGIGPVHRAHLHRKIGERLEEIYPPDQRSDLAVRLAQHFASAREWPRALVYLRSALRVAAIRYARRDALVILDLACELAAKLSGNHRISAEIEFLERRAAILVATNDVAAREIYAQLATRAAQLGDIDTQCRALVGLAYTAGWHDLAYSVQILDQVLVLCDKQTNPIQRDVTRMTAYVGRLSQAGWNRSDARKCEEVLARLEASGDVLAIARAQAHFSLLCLLSTRYREVVDLVASSHHLLLADPQHPVEAELARTMWMRDIGVPWCLFSLGEFGAGLSDLDASIAVFEKNSDLASANYLRVFRGALLLHVLNFEEVLRGCGPVAANPFEQDAESIILPVERRMALIFCGLAEAALENHLGALDYLRTAEREMEEQPAFLDWYWRLHLEWGMVNALIAKGDHPAALTRAESLCELTAQTDERAWQALAWEARARAALSCGESSKAADNVANALAACEGVSVPIAEWRVHATSAIIYKAVGDHRRAKRHTQMGAAVRRRLAESLPDGDPVRLNFERRSVSISAA
ncbi:MAG: Transcriptional regulatory protein terminal, partial [Gammaproteobacteria bacterium]|nr:Transcriptional regulatory protein terminal [Gammaproteobacteria bacterium]